MTTKYKSATAHCIAVMEEMKSSPMADVVKALTQRVSNRKGNKFTVGEAKTAYAYLVKNGKAPGKIEKLTVVKAPKAKTSADRKNALKAATAPKAPADRLTALKAAAKRAGIHKDSVETKTESKSEGDDPLGLAAPEKLTMSDLKALL